MNRRDRVLQAVNHKEPDVVPAQVDFFDDEAQEKFLPPVGAGATADWREEIIAQFEFLDSSFVRVVKSGFLAKTIRQEPGAELFEFETGTRWRIHHAPYWREYVAYPIVTREDLRRFRLPDPNGQPSDGFFRNYKVDNMYKPDLGETSRYDGVSDDARFFAERGFFTSGEINGFFSGVWYYLRPFTEFLMDLAADRVLARELIDMIGRYNLEDAENLLRAGVDCIDFADDLGHNQGLFFSPRLYQELVYPWHRSLADLCHRYGAYVNMHSHGNINEILPLIVEAGIDILNPVGPSDGMNLRQLKREFGRDITLMGGISKFIGEMSRRELEAHVCDVVAEGAPGGGFILREEGGIPAIMNESDFRFYLDTSRKHRTRGPKNHEG